MHRAAVTLVVISTLLSATGAQAAPFNYTPSSYQYSQMFTNTVSVVDSSGSTNFNSGFSPYYGWLGVNGALQVLGSAGAMQANDHALVSLSALGSNGGFLQAGVFKGKIFEFNNAPPSCTVGNCVNSPTAYSVYFETQEAAFSTVLSFGGAGSAANIFRIQQSAGAWHIYDLYNNEFTGPYVRSWTTGAMYASNEVMKYNSTVEPIAPTNAYFGNSNSASNSAMRLLGATGYKPWNGSLLAGSTMRVYDTTVSPAINQAIYSTFYEWGSY